MSQFPHMNHFLHDHRIWLRLVSNEISTGCVPPHLKHVIQRANIVWFDHGRGSQWNLQTCLLLSPLTFQAVLFSGTRPTENKGCGNEARNIINVRDTNVTQSVFDVRYCSRNCVHSHLEDFNSILQRVKLIARLMYKGAWSHTDATLSDVRACPERAVTRQATWGRELPVEDAIERWPGLIAR